MESTAAGGTEEVSPPAGLLQETHILLASVKEQELQFERLTRELQAERHLVASQLERCILGAGSPGDDSSSASEKSFAWRSPGSLDVCGQTQGGVMETSPPSRIHPEPEQASLHDSEGSGGHSVQMTSYSDSGYHDSSIGYYSNQNVVRSEPRPSLSGASGQAAGQAPGQTLRRGGSLPSRSPGALSRRTSQGSAYDSPVLSEPRPLASIFPGPALSQEGRGYGLGADPYGLYQHSALSRPDSLIGLHSSYGDHMTDPCDHMTDPGGHMTDSELRAALSPNSHMTSVFHDCSYHSAPYRTTDMGTLHRTSSNCSTLPCQQSSYGLCEESYRVPQQGAIYSPSPSVESIHKDPRELAWRDPELCEVIQMLQHHFPSVQSNAAAYLQHLCYRDNGIKMEVSRLGGLQLLVDLLDHKDLEVQRSACGALRNLVYGSTTDHNKVALRNCGGVPALLRLLRSTSHTPTQELVTGVLWNLSSCDAVKMTIVRDALTTVTNTLVVPHSGWSEAPPLEHRPHRFHPSLLLRNTTGCLRNLSSAGEESRGEMRRSEGLVDALLHILRSCKDTQDYDSKIVENSVCTLRNLSYRLEVEMPSSRLLGNQELDALLGLSSSGAELDYLCWGRRRRRGRSQTLEQWEGAGPMSGSSPSLRGAELLWHPSVVRPYLRLLAHSSNPSTLEGAAGSLQNLSAGNWKFSCYVRAAVRKERGLPVLVELLRVDKDRVVGSVATAIRNMALDPRNKELIGKYGMRDLIGRLPGPASCPSPLSDDTLASLCCALHEVASRNHDNARALVTCGGLCKLVHISQGRGLGYSVKLMRAAAQALNTLWAYRHLRSLYKQEGWSYNHLVTPTCTLERERYRSQPMLPISPVVQSGGSATSSPAGGSATSSPLGFRRRSSNQQRALSSMQLESYYGDNSLHRQYAGKKPPYVIQTCSPGQQLDDIISHDSPQQMEFYEEADPGFRMFLSSPPLTPPSLDGQGVKSNYVDFFSSSCNKNHSSSPDSWV